MFCVLHTTRLRERLVETESAIGLPVSGDAVAVCYECRSRLWALSLI
jgi:hypothetical protein